MLDKDLWREGACLLVLFDSSAKLSYHVSVDLLTSAKLKQSWRSVSTKENFDPRPSNCDIHIKGEKLLIPKGSKYDYTVLQPLQTASLKHVHRHMTHTKKSDRFQPNTHRNFDPYLGKQDSSHYSSPKKCHACHNFSAFMFLVRFYFVWHKRVTASYQVPPAG